MTDIISQYWHITDIFLREHAKILSLTGTVHLCQYRQSSLLRLHYHHDIQLIYLRHRCLIATFEGSQQKMCV